MNMYELIVLLLFKWESKDLIAKNKQTTQRKCNIRQNTLRSVLSMIGQCDNGPPCVH